MGLKEYASKEWVYDRRNDKNFINGFEFDYLTLVDKKTGYKHYLYVLDGQIATAPIYVYIEVESMPDKIVYMFGEKFDDTGMVVSVMAQDGTRHVVTDYVYSHNVTSSDFIISYIDDLGNSISTTINLVLTEFDPSILIDFIYTENEDGTYTLNGWKGTYNGEESTELIIPDNVMVKL
jgi:hypothetical protein